MVVVVVVIVAAAVGEIVEGVGQLGRGRAGPAIGSGVVGVGGQHAGQRKGFWFVVACDGGGQCFDERLARDRLDGSRIPPVSWTLGVRAGIRAVDGGRG